MLLDLHLEAEGRCERFSTGNSCDRGQPDKAELSNENSRLLSALIRGN
jgi:hypothetical protein